MSWTRREALARSLGAFALNRLSWSVLAAALVGGTLAFSGRGGGSLIPRATAAQQGDGAADPVFGITIPPGYRDWTLITVGTVGPPLSDIRAKLANPLATRAFRQGNVPYPDGAIIARLAWKQSMSAENNAALLHEAFLRGVSADAIEQFLNGTIAAGQATTLQIMVKDSKKYALTGGWGYAQFANGKPAGAAVGNSCLPCHVLAKSTDYVFSRYSP